MHLRFVSAIGASAFMHELLGVIAFEARESGIAATLSRGAFPRGEPDDVYVVVPHEYFVVTPQSQHPTPDQLARTIALCVEHPGNVSFEMSVHWARAVARVLDINDDSTAALRARGVHAERFTLGYSAAWDAWGGDEVQDRDIDVTYLGTTDPRRSRAVASYAERFASRNAVLLMPPHEPMTKPRPDFLIGRDKLEWLRRSKVLLNLHRGLSVSLEWVRVLEALCNGSVVVTEHSIAFAPLVPGRHLLFGHWRTLGEITDVMLDAPERLQQTRQAAYEFLTKEYTMRPSVTRLIELAADLPHRESRPRPSRPAAGVPLPASLRPSEEIGVYGAVELPKVDPRAQAAVALGLARAELWPDAELLPRASRGEGSVDAVIACGLGDPRPVLAVASLLEQEADVDLLVRVASQAWLRGADSPTLTDPRVHVEVPEGSVPKGVLRNRLLAASDADYVLVLDATDVVLPGALARLTDRLARDGSADACYPLIADADGGIGNALPFEPERLSREPYLTSAALWRRRSLVDLGGWCQEPELDSLEDHDLWLRLAAAGGVALLLPQILVRRHWRGLRPIRLADVDSTLIDRLGRSPKSYRPDTDARTS